MYFHFLPLPVRDTEGVGLSTKVVFSGILTVPLLHPKTNTSIRHAQQHARKPTQVHAHIHTQTTISPLVERFDSVQRMSKEEVVFMS